MKKSKITYFVLILILICSFSFASFAEDIGNLLNQQTDLQEKQNTSTTKLETIQSELTIALQQIQGLNENITKYEEEIKQLSKKVELLQVSISEIEGRLSIAQENYEKQKQLLDDRLLTIYEAGDTNYLDVLLNSKNITDFISNYYLVSELTQYDTEFLDEIEKQKRSIETNRKMLENQKNDFDTIKKNKEKTTIILQNSRAIKNSYMNQLSEDEKTIQTEIETYTAQINEIEQEIKAIMLQNIDSKYIGGVMAWPVPGYTRITSQYGMRTHPITGIYKLHSGVDLGAPAWANFVAANDGVVVKAGFNSAYGNMVMIDHGGGVSTLYAHGNEIVVTLGQTVKKGDVVLKVGSTGYSTGAHAHFEVRVNGDPVDPMPYITTTALDEKTEE